MKLTESFMAPYLISSEAFLEKRINNIDPPLIFICRATVIRIILE